MPKPLSALTQPSPATAQDASKKNKDKRSKTIKKKKTKDISSKTINLSALTTANVQRVTRLSLKEHLPTKLHA